MKEPEFRIILRGSLLLITPHIKRVVNSLEYDSLAFIIGEQTEPNEYSVHLLLSFGTFENFAQIQNLRPNANSSLPIKNKNAMHRIAEIRLQTIPNNRTLFILTTAYEYTNADHDALDNFILQILTEFKILGFSISEEQNSDKKLSDSSTEQIKAFIAHEGETLALTKIKNFLDSLDIKYLIAEKEPSDGRLTEGQVSWTYRQADFAIILATKGKAINKKTGKHYMGLNVADELGRSREVFKNHIILLLQKGVDPQTNITGIIYEHFTSQNMDNAFIKILKELKNWDFIKTGKPGIENHAK